MKKINFGCGSNRLNGWDNYDMDCDITQPLPFEDNSVDFIFNEHVIEHISQKEGYNFLKEAKRILKPGGIIRTATPSLTKIGFEETENYRNFQRIRGWGNGEPGCGMRAILFEHGHQCVYTVDGFLAICHSLGLEAKEVPVGQSEIADLKGVEGHWLAIGKEFNDLETFCVEAKKPLDIST